MEICNLNILFMYVWNRAPRSFHDTIVLTMAQDNDLEFLLPPTDKYYAVNSGYPNNFFFYLAPYRSSQNRVVSYHMSQFYNGFPPRNKQELFNRFHASLRFAPERTFGVWKKKQRILCNFSRYETHVLKRIVTATRLHNYIRISHYFDEDFAEVMGQTEINNTHFETKKGDMKTREIAYV